MMIPLECKPCENGGSFQNTFSCECDCHGFNTGALCSGKR